MCTRIVQSRLLNDYAVALGWNSSEQRRRWPEPNYNAGLGHRIIIAHTLNRIPDGKFSMSKWGLRPQWATDTGLPIVINAHYSHISERRYYRDLWEAGNRVLVPLDGWYEWQKRRGARIPWFIHAAGRECLFMPALSTYDEDADRVGKSSQVVVITDDKQQCLVNGSGRAPIFLTRSAASNWASNSISPDKAMELLIEGRYRPDLVHYRVSFRVNNREPNDRELLRRLQPGQENY